MRVLQIEAVELSADKFASHNLILMPNLCKPKANPVTSTE
jgi:hypothetical protein